MQVLPQKVQVLLGCTPCAAAVQRRGCGYAIAARTWLGGQRRKETAAERRVKGLNQERDRKMLEGIG
jgi:hypothetical protein